MNAETVRPDEILVVDDTTENLKLLEDILGGAGYRVRLADDGELALRSARIQPPSLVLLDIRMPGMDGYEVCRRLKDDDRTRSVPVIFLSILEDERDKVKGFREGAVDYITKPFQREEVLARIQTHLRLRELTERLEQKVAERTEELAIANQLLQREIAERKRAEEKISNSLEEKEILLKEVHHRVKNNMQIISTLLDLQSEGISDKGALEAFRESQERIKAMALIHERLYESKDLASIDFQLYIGDLSTHLFDTYLVDPGRISLQMDAGGVSLEIDQAIPCGLIINELFSNALKYAFPDNRKGEIHLDLQAGDDGTITLRVADNGVGLPPGMDFTKTGTLGLQLVNMLIRQLRGEVRLEGGQRGTAFIISFPGSRSD